MEKVIEIIGDIAIGKLKEFLSERKFKSELLQVSQSITMHLEECSLTEDIESMLSDQCLETLIDESIQNNGFDFETNLSKGFEKLSKLYEIPEETRNTCFRMLWQSIEQYLQKYHPDFYNSVLIDDTHSSVKNIEQIVINGTKRSEEEHRMIVETHRTVTDLSSRLLNDIGESKKESTDTVVDTNKYLESNKNSIVNEICIIIEHDKSVECLPEDKLTLANWIAEGCSKNVIILIQDKSIDDLEKACHEIENKVKSGNITNEDYNELISLREQKNKQNFYVQRLQTLIKLFIEINKTNYYIQIYRIEDFILFVQYAYNILTKKNNSNDNKIVAFTLNKGEHKNNFHFKVIIDVAALKQAGLDDSMNYFDIIRLDYYSFDSDTQKKIVASFINALLNDEEANKRKLWEDKDLSDLYNYDLAID